MNQLLRENNQAANKTWVWTYDNAGNIQSKSEYAYTTGELGEAVDTVSYGYTDENWGDLLTSYDGNTIIYDEIGNPLVDGTWEYTWEHGRELSSMTDGETAWNFTYDSNGMRTSRSNGSTTYEYIYNGSQLVQMSVGNDVLYFTSDTVTLNNTTYYYVKNLQGDITAIVDGSGTAVVEYTYDAWGNILSISGELANTLGVLNPLRYRGYVFDSESGFYYLQSRYYDSELGRFINADALVSTGQGLLGNNMFTYCLNNPVNYLDSAGSRAESATENEDSEENEKYRFVGIGFQGELNVGAYEVGFEVIIYTDPLVCGGDEPIVAVYIYEGAFVSITDLTKSTQFIKTVGKLSLAVATNAIDEQNAEALLIALQQALFKDISVSGSVVAIFGNEEFKNTGSYEGAFDTFSATVKHVKFTYSYSPSCRVVAVGASTSKYGLSYGQSYYVQVK